MLFSKRLSIFIASTYAICLVGISAAQSNKQLIFTDIDGLPRNIVNCVDQDEFGYLWLATANGVARFDGINFHNYQFFANQMIYHLCVDSANKVWVATGNGLYIYNRRTDTFDIKGDRFSKKISEDDGEIYFIDATGINKIEGTNTKLILEKNLLRDFCFSPEGIWLISNAKGVSLLSRESDFKTLTNVLLSNNTVTAISYINGKTYFGCKDGSLFELQHDNFAKPVYLSNHHIIKAIEKIGDEIWIATGGNGIIVLNNKLQVLKTLNRNDNENSISINTNSILDVFKGKNDEIWVATYGAGLTCILPDNLLFTNIIPEKGNANSLIANEGTFVSEKDNIFYFGTNYGLSVWDEKKNHFTNKSLGQLTNELNGHKVSSICKVGNDNWIGTYDGSLGRYTNNFKFIETIKLSEENIDEMQQIIFLHNYNNTNLMVGTHYPGKPLINYNVINKTASLVELEVNNEKTTQFDINAIHRNQNNDLLVLVSYKGLYKVNTEENALVNIYPELNKKLFSWISDFYHDKSDNYWMTTSSEGLWSISSDGEKIKKWTVNEGLPTNSLLQLESIDDHFLWISTTLGLCRFDMQTEEILVFNTFDGLDANDFTDRTSSVTSDGRIVFGSYAGFTIVDPDKIKPNTNSSKVIISDITFQNISIKSPENNYLLNDPIEAVKELVLPFEKNSFTIHFFTKNKVITKYTNYKYRLNGLEDDWISLNKSNQITYTNLNPGSYTFEVRSSIKQNSQYDNATSLRIIISPPWYKRWYAYLIYLMLISTLFFAVFYAIYIRINYKKEIEISNYKIEKEKELTEKKLRFFTNISHDLKTPLTLIDAPIFDLLQSETITDAEKNKLILIRRNSKRLYNLISDLIDFRKLTHKKVLLKVGKADIKILTLDIYDAFKSECENKNIALKTDIQIDYPIYVDSKKIEKIIWNLLSNAVKYTPKNGQISLLVQEINREEHSFIQIIVDDTGIGIEKEYLDKIFERFYQVQNERSISIEGTGIGLAIVSDLVQIHKGEIHVKSTVNEGSTFTVTIPSGRNSYNDSELSLEKIKDDLVIGTNKISHIEPEVSIMENDQIIKYNLPVLLIVEDNFELIHYLNDHFKRSYKVIQASNGIEGLQIAQEKNIDVIITDVSMPKMNGYEFCKELRLKFDTSHIPVIMLTANSSVEHQIEGLSTGADIYLTKPIDILLLDASVKSILENRKKIRNKFLGIDTLHESENILSEKDKKFIDDLKIFIDENLINEHLNVEMISKHFAVNRAQLNRKIKSLTGKTTIKLITSIRLKKAYKLIREDGMRVSEASDLTGFSDPNYFSICFKKEFGENPSKI